MVELSALSISTVHFQNELNAISNNTATQRDANFQRREFSTPIQQRDANFQ